ncbi:MAG: hypothetical protein A2161_20625 [Candidatus Schekmanbacteria bacterium RBG_13_48_7]|uniref:DUF4911 domain-containing protein n=1 Tax=Candidatus Schekmanbacteria bacterium RBG_13_48_7 TaxID=1817878 RepID=A0A1F7S3A0_9BACT|nr:MAG: hypothetical protein A2161_20625 [Candidatus Schekmanbacteria bacterium RBG_13_48_7]
MDDSLRNTVQLYLKVNRRDIAYLANIVSCYEGIALMRTKDPHFAIIEWQVSPDFLDETLALIESLKKELSIEIVQWEGNA